MTVIDKHILIAKPSIRNKKLNLSVSFVAFVVQFLNEKFKEKKEFELLTLIKP